jgi:hypothetical protein
MASVSAVILSLVFVAPISWGVILLWTDWLVTGRANVALALESLPLVLAIDNLSMPRCKICGWMVPGS